MRNAILYERKLVQTESAIDVQTGDFNPLSAPKEWKTIEIGPCIFHQFGVDVEKCDESIASYTTAVVEMPDGELRNPPVAMVKLLGEVPDMTLISKTSAETAKDCEVILNGVKKMEGDISDSILLLESFAAPEYPGEPVDKKLQAVINTLKKNLNLIENLT